MRYFLLCFLLFVNAWVCAQTSLGDGFTMSGTLPHWAVMMYGENPNYYDVVNAYEDCYTIEPFEKNIHTQHFKRWVSQVKSLVMPDGQIRNISADERMQMSSRMGEIQQTSAARGGELWHFEGPVHHVVSDGTMTAGFRHSNVYCHDRSAINPSVLFCGTESGGLYKTTDASLNWEYVTKEEMIGAVTAVRIKPSDDDVILMGAADEMWRSTDGGNSWEIIGQPSFVSLNLSVWEIAFHPLNNDIVFAATTQGFFRSEDGGDNWTEVLNDRCETIAFNPIDPSTIYTIQFESTLGYAKFYKSIDDGQSFTMYDDGWFDASMGDINIRGGRLATTEANPDRIYALLVGYQNDGSSVTTNGWVGTWVSDDGGSTWSLPHGLIGTPYTEDHPNLMNFNGDDGDYSQIHYNTTLIASQLDPNKILIGGLNLWMSSDGGATYEGVGGYIGGKEYFHVDQQEYRIYKTSATTEEIWFSNDGGIGFSNDFMETHQNLNRGLFAVNLWGYDQGWNEDIMVGGRYHNGNMAYHENYPEGEFLALGGGEAATGYVKYTDENKALFSDIGGYNLPEVLDEEPTYFSIGQTPNESYWNNGSSRIMFDHAYYDVAWCGRDNKLYRSANGGGSFSEFHTFGTDPNVRLYWMEQSYADHNYMYIQQGDDWTSSIWRTTNHGETWSEIPLPQNWRYLSFTLSGTNPDELWLSYYDGGNGSKVYHTDDAGLNWENMTTSTLNDQSVWAIAHQYGTDGGVYIAMLHGLVYYRNNSMDDWQSYSTGLPVSSEPLRIVPFIRQNVVRLATWNLGVWEAPAFEESALIADFAASFGTFFCPGDEVHFVDHSVCSDAATYSWSFPGANPSSSTDPFPTVVYDSPGTYDVTLVVTDGNDSQSVTKTNYISSTQDIASEVQEDFESGSFPENWIMMGNGNWTIAEQSAAAIGDYCMKFDNYYYDAQGQRDEIWLGKMNVGMGLVEFDVAYAQYADNYSDTLAVLFSEDCGLTWTTLYIEGGDDLATSPDFTGYFEPTASQWEHHGITIDANSTEVIIAFQNRGHYGNVIYVDNINIEEIVGTEVLLQASSVSIYPNPARDMVNISVQGLLPGSYTYQIHDSEGRLVSEEVVYTAGSRIERVLTTSALASGLYILTVYGGSLNLSQSFNVDR